MAPFLRVESLSRWELAGKVGEALKAFASVCALALLKPIDFFRTLAHEGADFRKRTVRALVFAFMMGYLKFFCDAAHLYGLSVVARRGSFSPELAGQVNAISAAFFSSPFVFMRPALVFLMTLAVVAFSVKLVFGPRRKLVGAFFVVCYASAAQAFCLVPIIGGTLSSVWSVALLTIGIREFYRTGVWQAVFAAVVMPLVILIFSMLAMGPSLNRAVIMFYPEAQAQMVRLNDVSAYATTQAVAKAAEDYKKELGFYPATLDALKKYLPVSVAELFGNADSAAGYYYHYAQADDAHFTLETVPQEPGATGNFKLFTDQSGVIRLNGPQGKEIRDMKEFEELYASG